MITNSHTKKLVLTALFTALITLSTMVIQIPMPISGYVNLGDVFVLISAFILGPIYGTLAAGLGSALADLLSGYIVFAPATLIIKSIMVLVAYAIYFALKKTFKNLFWAKLISSAVAELVMVLGYFFYSCLIMGEGLVAALSIPGNLIQGAVGIVFAVFTLYIIDRTNIGKDK